MQILKDTAIISIFTIISQILGVIRDKLLITIVGVGVVLDIYNASFKIPDLLIAILVSFVGLTVVVPYFNNSLAKNSEIELRKKFNTILIFFSFSIIILSLIIILTLDIFLGKLFPAFSGENLTLLSNATKLMLLQPLLMGISNLFACYAQSYKKFLYYALAPIFYNLGIIYGIIFLYEKHNLMGLVYGVLIGAALHILVNFIFIVQNKLHFNFSDFDIKYIKEILPIAGWRSVAFITVALKQFSITIVAGLMGMGIITAWTFALNLLNMCVQFFATSFAIASFPSLSMHYEKGEYDILKKTIDKNVKEIFIFSCLFALLMYLIANYVVGLIYNGDSRVLELFYVLIFAIPFLNLEQYYARAMMAIHKVKSLSFVLIASLIFLVIAISASYMIGFSYINLAYAYLFTTIFQVLIVYVLGQRYLRDMRSKQK